jgi:hypothetical protein
VPGLSQQLKCGKSQFIAIVASGLILRVTLVANILFYTAIERQSMDHF